MTNPQFLTVGIAGPLQSGKSTLVQTLIHDINQDFFPGVSCHTLSFAYPLKRALSFVLREQIEKENEYYLIPSDFKNYYEFLTLLFNLPSLFSPQESYPFIGYQKGSEAKEQIFSKMEDLIFFQRLTGRQLLQRFGTEIMRVLFPSVWIQILKETIHQVNRYQPDQPHIYFIDDLRFPDESKALDIHLYLEHPSQAPEQIAEHESESYQDFLRETAVCKVHRNTNISEITPYILDFLSQKAENLSSVDLNH